MDRLLSTGPTPSSFAGFQPFGWVPSIWLAPNKILSSCQTHIWLSSSHLDGIQLLKSLIGWLTFGPASQMWLQKNLSGWKHVFSVSTSVQPCWMEEGWIDWGFRIPSWRKRRWHKYQFSEVKCQGNHFFCENHLKEISEIQFSLVWLQRLPSEPGRSEALGWSWFILFDIGLSWMILAHIFLLNKPLGWFSH